MSNVPHVNTDLTPPEIRYSEMETFRKDPSIKTVLGVDDSVQAF